MEADPTLEVRRAELLRLGARDDTLQELLSYCANPFDRARLPEAPVLPQPEEPHVADWRRYAEESQGQVLAYLQARLPQLVVPVRPGQSRTEAYARVARRGLPVPETELGGRLALAAPEHLELRIVAHPAGALPVLMTDHRGDFETLLQVLAHRCEPVPVPPSVSANTIGGFINWDRVARCRQAWLEVHGEVLGAAAWGGELQRIAREESWRIKDRFMVVFSGPYSGVRAAELGLDLSEDAWLQRSLTIRLEHELTHHATWRLYGVMRLNLLDEIICDWAGLTASLGTFRASHFLHFLGLEAWPQQRAAGRLQAYLGELGKEAREVLTALAVDAARGLEMLATRSGARAKRSHLFLALTRMTLELLACDERERHLEQALAETTAWLTPARAG